MTKSREELSLNELYDRMDEIAACFYSKPCRRPELHQATIDLGEVSENVTNFAIKVGSLIIMKMPAEDKHNIVVKKLSISGLIHLDKHPQLIKNPMQLLEEINYF